MGLSFSLEWKTCESCEAGAYIGEGASLIGLNRERN